MPSITTKIIYIDPDPWVTAEEMEETCCTSIAPPPCKKKVEPWVGYNENEAADELGISIDENGLDQNGMPVKIMLIRPESGQCGEQVTTYSLVPEDCCEGVLEMSYDTATSLEVLSPGESGIIGISDGKGPYTFKIFGNDITFDSGQKTIITNDKSLWVHAGDDFCGSANIEITDICNYSAVGALRSTVGQWVLVSSGPKSSCLATAELVGICGQEGWFSGIQGKYMVSEYYIRSSWPIGSLEEATEFCHDYGCPYNDSFPCLTGLYSGCTKICDWCGWDSIANKAAYNYVTARNQYEWKC